MIENNTLARPYAKAAFAHAQDTNETAKWSQILTQLAALVKIPEIADLLRNPKLSGEQAVELISSIEKEVTGSIKNFAHVLAQNRRLSLLPAIRELFNEYKASAERTINVNITSAFPLEDAQCELFAQLLGKCLQKKVHVNSETDEKLIGGAIIRAGDQVIDGSVRGRLKQLAESLING